LPKAAANARGAVAQ